MDMRGAQSFRVNDMFSVLCAVTLFCSIYFCSCLYEDQIGKFEWRHCYVGKPVFSQFDISSPIKKVIIGTEQNVLAAIHLKSGDIIWRQAFESGEAGKIRLLFVDEDIITITGMNTPLVRGWDVEMGHLIWEWAITKHGEHTKWLIIGQKIVQIDFAPKSQILVSLLNGTNGKKLRSQVIPSPWLIPENCLLQSDVLCCMTSDKLIYSIKLTDGVGSLNIKIHHRSLLDLFKQEITGNLKETPGPLPVVTINVGHVDRPILLQPELRVIQSGNEDFKLFATTSFDDYKMITSAFLTNEELVLETRDLQGEMIQDLCSSVAMPKHHGSPESLHIFCQPKRDRDFKIITCRLVIVTTHDVVIVAQFPGKILWAREEALSSIVTAEMIELPVSDTDAAIEKEFDNKNIPDAPSCGFVGMFFRRLISQFFQLQNIVFNVVDIGRKPSRNKTDELTRDEFGLHKIIVVVTKPGKICGIDSLSGKIIWQVLADGVEPFPSISGSQVMPLFVLRTARHSPLAAKCVVLGMEKGSGYSVLIVFNPITGALDDAESRVVKLGFKAKQSLLSRHANENFLRGLILLDEENKVHVYPDSAAKEIRAHAPSTYIYSADSSGIFEGFGIAQGDGDTLVASRNWLVNLGLGGDKIVAIVGKNSQERVHSQGRVLGDRSVLYKYVNPNLVAVMTQRTHPASVLNLYLIDVVTGSIVHSVTHRRAKDPVHLVHSENWVIYTFYNEKFRRTELSALELYEGKTQSNATAFSSVDSTLLQPIVERQAYILPANVLALKETITEKGITSKHILVALTNGGILELPWMYADPRRPVSVTAEMREEGVIPYVPELPIALDSIINHNQTIMRIRDIHTSSSGLESTCLVFAYGLDVFYTRVAPSKMFDLLKDDFDYFVITTVLLILLTISYITRKLASRKALKQAWK